MKEIICTYTLSGHPNIENGKRPEENHVSSTSGSCSIIILSTFVPNCFAAFSLASLSECALTQ